MATVIAGQAARLARRSTVARTGPRVGHAPGRWLVVACAVAVAACSNGPEPQPRPLALDRVISDGQLPWTDRLLPPQIPTVVPPGPPGADLPNAGDGLSVPGDRVGLYGGSLDRVLCDRERLVADLESDPIKMQAWSGVLDVDDVRSYVRTLTPVLLRADTRVTNYGYSGERATSYQSVLEAGTIVLIDDHGTPRVRCARGSPLIDPRPSSEPAATDDAWPGYDAERLLVVQPAQQPMAQVTVVDLMSGGLAAVPVGAGPQQPADRPGPPPPLPPPGPPPPPPPPVVEPEPLAVAPPPVQRQAPAPPPAPAPAPEPPPPAPEPPPPPAPVPVAPPPPPPQIQVQIPGLPPLVIPVP